ncbi:MAG: Gfo/Idh/MocA family oxidoreductase [Bacteroidota bacterium]
MNRRSFLQNSLTVAAGSALATTSPLSAKALNFSPNEKYRIGLIGANGMGWRDLTAFLKQSGVECAAIADIDQSVLDRRAADAETLQGFKPQLFKDYRRMLEMKDIDAVIIGSPDHWHCLHYCDALAAGKHVYCEKPLGRTIQECKIMLAAAKRNPGKMVQINQWQRSGTHYASALDYIKSGKLGKVRLIKTWSYVGWKKPLEFKPDSAAPEGVDYDFWLGPAPKRPFNPNRFHFEFRWFWDYAGGLMTDWGVHEIDIALEGLGLKTPKSVMASGGKFGYPDSDGQTPDTLQAVYEFDSCNILWEHILGISGGPYGRAEGIAFIGNNATLVIDRNNWSLLPESEKAADGLLHYKAEKLPDQVRPTGTEYVDLHAKNFLDCIRDNTPEKLNCGIETAANVAINCCIGNISQRLGRKVYWDAEKGMFKNDREADRMMDADYQNGWKLPV